MPPCNLLLSVCPEAENRLCSSSAKTQKPQTVATRSSGQVWGGVPLKQLLSFEILATIVTLLVLNRKGLDRPQHHTEGLQKEIETGFKHMWILWESSATGGTSVSQTKKVACGFSYRLWRSIFRTHDMAMRLLRQLALLQLEHTDV